MKALIGSVIIVSGLVVVGTAFSVVICLIVPLLAQALGY